MVGTIQISARVRDHLDLADVEARAFGIVFFGGFAGEEIADHGRRQSLIGDHSVYDGVAQIDQFFRVRQDSESVQKGTLSRRIFDLFMLNFNLC
jgi:hypothetical protein